MKYIKEDEVENKDALIDDIKKALTKDDSYYENLKNLSQDELLEIYSKTKGLDTKTEKEKDKYDLIDEFYNLVDTETEILKKYNENTSYFLEVIESLNKGDIDIVDNNSNLDINNLDSAPIIDFKNLIKMTKDFPYSFVVDTKFFSLPLRYKYSIIALCIFPNIIRDDEEAEEFGYDLDNMCKSDEKDN